MAAHSTVSSRSMHQSGIIYFALKTMLKYSNCLSWAFRSQKALKCPLVGFVQKMESVSVKMILSSKDMVKNPSKLI